MVGVLTEETKTEAYQCISEDGLRIRAKKTTDSEAVGSIPFEAVVTVLEVDGEWAHLQYDGNEGYSKVEFLKKNSDDKESTEKKP